MVADEAPVLVIDSARVLESGDHRGRNQDRQHDYPQRLDDQARARATRRGKTRLSWLEVFVQAAIWPGLITTGVLTVAIAAEMLAPRRVLSLPLGWRWGNNLGLALITWALSHLVSVAIYFTAAKWAVDNEVGLFAGRPDWFLLPLAALFLVSQFFAYVTHVIFHRYPLLWRLHEIHHSDVDIDVSTSYRHHPLEPLVFMPVITPLILLLGVSPTVALSYQGIGIALTVFAHSNLRVPEAIERWLCKIVVTPDFHRLHHSSEQRYTNSNYGGIVPWFDHLFGTATHRPFDDHETMELGLEYHRAKEESRVDRLLLAPLKAPRPDEQALKAP